MKVAVLQTGHAPEALRPMHGDYDDMSKTLIGYSSHKADTFDICHGEFPKHPKDYHLYIVTGSPCGVYENYPWIAKLEDFIRLVFRYEVKLIGLCFGHQIIAQAMGGHVVKSEKGYGIGVLSYNLSHHPYSDTSLSLCAWHQDQVIQSPKTAQRILTSEFCPNAGFVYSRHAITFQPHPEFTKNFVKDLVNIRVGDTITTTQAHQALETLKSKDTDTPLIQKLIREFLKIDKTKK